MEWMVNDVGSICGVRKENDNDDILPVGMSVHQGKWQISLPEFVTCIPSDFFSNTSKLLKIIIPNTVSIIANGAFMNCSNLEEIKLPDGLKKISDSLFKNCSKLKEIVIPDSVEVIEGEAFSGCSSLINVVIPNSVKRIDWNSFSGCINLKYITIPDSVEEIGGKAFSGCSSLVSVELPNKINEIRDNAFSDCISLKHIIIPDSVKYIGRNVFSGCCGINIVMPNLLHGKLESACTGCRNLKYITISERKDEALRFQQNWYIGVSGSDPLDSLFGENAKELHENNLMVCDGKIIGYLYEKHLFVFDDPKTYRYDTWGWKYPGPTYYLRKKEEHINI